MRRLYLGTAFLLAFGVHGAAFAQDEQGNYGGGGAYGSATALETRISQLENQLRLMNGRLEQADYQNKQLRSQIERMQGDVSYRLDTLEKQKTAAPAASAPTARAPHAAAPADDSDDTDTDIPAPVAPTRAPARSSATETPAKAAESAAPEKPITGQLGNLYVNGSQVTGADKSSRVPVLPPKPADFGLTAREQYDRSFALLRGADYDAAEAGFKSFIEKNPQDKLIDNAKYWLGETHYVRNQYDAAAVAFADAFQTAPKGSKAPDSLLKLGMSLGNLGKKADACTTLGEVKNQFPNAPATIRSRTEQELKRLKCA